MKRVTFKMFFAVIWKGICQAFGWFLGLFGYKREGKFAKVFWNLFSFSVAVVIIYIAVGLVCNCCKDLYRQYKRWTRDDYDYGWRQYVSRDVDFVFRSEGTCYVYNTCIEKKTIENVAWIRSPLGEDTLVVYSDGKRRGYFDKHSGKVVIKPKYTHAWVFSDGIASVEENGVVKFIDQTGKQAFKRSFKYHKNDEYVFHGGYCVIDSDNDGKYGMMDQKGVTVVPEVYDRISVAWDLCHWAVTRGDSMGVLDKERQMVLPMVKGYVYVNDNTIDVTMDDNTIRKYDKKGNLINDFYIRGFDHLEYETEYGTEWAKLWYYTAGHGMCGLMTEDGHVVTMPKYWNITAVGEDLYMCTESLCGDYELLNGKGERVK